MSLVIKGKTLPIPEMKLQSSKLSKLAFLGGASLSFVQAVQAATTLTGDGQANNSAVDAAHGSNLPGTPNITAGWSPVGPGGWEAWAGWTNLSPLNETGIGVYQVDSANAGDSYTITFTPDATFDVVLNSIDFNVYTGALGAGFNIDWDVSGATSGSLGSGSYAPPVASNTTLSFGGLTGSGSEVVTLELTMAVD